MAGYRVPFAVSELTYEEALHVVKSSLRFGIVPLLETVEDMLAELGDPDLCYRSLQVAGTNGKTSTARYTAAIIAGEGYRVGLYTSPELVRYTERMEIDGAPVSDRLFARGIAAAQEAARRVNERRSALGLRPYDVTEFDMLTVAACVMYALSDVDVVVFEVGMGGRWDATSAVKSICSVAITGIGLDHTRILGDTLEQIAAEKAAVIQRERTCVLGLGTAVPQSVEDVFVTRAREEGVRPVLLRAEQGVRHCAHGDVSYAFVRTESLPQRLGAPLQISLTTPRTSYGCIRAAKPAYQAQNIACAIVLAEQFVDDELCDEVVRKAVWDCPTPGRFDVVRADPLVLVDACHNPQSVEAFLSSVEDIEPDVHRRPTLLCAMLADKDTRSMVHLLASSFPAVVVTQTDSPRALASADLGRMFAEEGKVPRAVCASVEAGLQLLAGEPLVACGSITTAGAVIGMLRR